MQASDNSEVGYINENEVISMSCRVQFWGNWPPTMQWNVNEGILSHDDTINKYNNDSVTSVLHTVINSTRFPRTTLQFKCKTYFTRDNKPEHSTAPNIPQYSNTWSSPKIQINAGLGWDISDSNFPYFLTCIDLAQNTEFHYPSALLSVCVSVCPSVLPSFRP